PGSRRSTRYGTIGSETRSEPLGITEFHLNHNHKHKREIRFTDFGQFFAQFALASIQAVLKLIRSVRTRAGRAPP
ncbi:MAG TPA: hypothetical protein VGY91_09760, partial [Chthoniobacterales bacterium]|nr:hypothetical protein [Chthoniobacterales bacterium]